MRVFAGNARGAITSERFCAIFEFAHLYWRAELCSAPPGGRAELRSDAWPRPRETGLDRTFLRFV